jgi:hypothetical protein
MASRQSAAAEQAQSIPLLPSPLPRLIDHRTEPSVWMVCGETLSAGDDQEGAGLQPASGTGSSFLVVGQLPACRTRLRCPR